MQPTVFFGSALSIIAFLVFGSFFTETAAVVFNTVQAFIANIFGWLYIMGVAFMVGFVVWLVISPLGKIRLGGDDSRPDFLISSFGPSLIDVEVPDNKPPIFIAVRQFHPNVARALVALYQVWTQAGAPAEFHVYDQLGGSPFLGPTGEWLEEAHAWMRKRGFVPTAEAASQEHG